MKVGNFYYSVIYLLCLEQDLTWSNFLEQICSNLALTLKAVKYIILCLISSYLHGLLKFMHSGCLSFCKQDQIFLVFLSLSLSLLLSTPLGS